MRWLMDTIGGLYQLARLGAVTGFRFRGEYWTWRWHTAFGRGGPGGPGTMGRWEMLRSILDYGRWVHRVRRGA
jgi:hypothetical protein